MEITQDAGSLPVAGDNAGSPTAWDAQWDSSTQWAIPYERFQEVNARMKVAEEKLAKVEELEGTVNNLRSAFAPQKQENQVPDMYENPQAYAEWIQQGAIRQIDARTQAEQAAIQAENTRLDGQLSSLKETHWDVDSDAVQQHALKYNMRTPDWKWLDLSLAYANMLETWKVSPQATARAAAAPLWSSQTTRNPASNISQQELSRMSRSSGFSSYVASQLE